MEDLQAALELFGLSIAPPSNLPPHPDGLELGSTDPMEEDTYLCPGCDREVRVGSRGCPYCNPPAKRQRRKQRPKAAAKRARKSWEEDSTYDALDLPDEDFDYDDFVAREFGHKPHRKVGIRWYWWVTAIVLLVLMVLGGFGIWG